MKTAVAQGLMQDVLCSIVGASLSKPRTYEDCSDPGATVSCAYCMACFTMRIVGALVAN